ncbi:MAG: dTMP kinase [Phycisphaeraceae bacterium]|nr:dTMP kinase [Phycisphaeraceae bacterium]MCB9847742.1 dTMP kinase [Phycisphaeraceae bacterium]
MSADPTSTSSNGHSSGFPGKLIVVEGIDGSGKSTQLDLLHKWLKGAGYCVYFTEWNSSPVVKRTTSFGKANKLLSPMTFSLIHACDFAERLERAILPPLRAGAIVLADRYIYTAFARDAARGIDREYVRNIYSIAPVPDVAVYFKVPLDEALNRILAGRPELKYYEAGMDLRLSEDPYESFKIFQDRIFNEYERIVPERGLDVIDATQSIADQQKQFRALVKPHLKGVLRSEILPLADVLASEGLSGRYVRSR